LNDVERPQSAPQNADAKISLSQPVAAWKRILDLSLILISLPIALPLMLAVATWIKLVSRGPAIFRQVRIGRNGRPFTLYKFRSMHVDADPGRHLHHFGQLVRSNRPMEKLDLLCDTRLIPAGCLLRATGLDELPQLINILRGEMSLVGPRPCLPEEYRYFSRIQRVRFRALPGLTGIWQTQGKHLATFSEMNAMDARYVRDASPLLDLSIILRTPCAVLGQIRLAYLRHRAAKAARGEDKPLAALGTERLG
jgi:lipopolysaccharide/colanic/teichoic acid biosynthesis glycosyltransferase